MTDDRQHAGFNDRAQLTRQPARVKERADLQIEFRGRTSQSVWNAGVVSSPDPLEGLVKYTGIVADPRSGATAR